MVIPTGEDPEKLKEEYEEFLEDEDFTYLVESVFDEVGLDVRSMPYEDQLMIGKCPFAMKDNQTLSEYKQEICDKFKECGIVIAPDKLEQIEECWMDN